MTRELRQWIIPVIIIIFGAYACSNPSTHPPDDPVSNPFHFTKVGIR